MIRAISILLIVFLVNACATSNRSSFSKRKHLKGHFWNLKEKYRTSNSTNEKEDYSFKETPKAKGKIETKKTTRKPLPTVTVTEDDIVKSNSEKHVDVEALEEVTTRTAVESLDHQEPDEEKSEEYVSSDYEQRQLKQRPRKGEIIFAVLVFILMGLILLFGVVGLIISLFLKIYSTVIPWLFYTSLIIVSIPVLLFLIFLIVMIISDKKRKKVPAYGNS